MKITEIIPADLPGWAIKAMADGQLFNVTFAKINELENQLMLEGTTNSQRCDRCHLANFFNGEEFKCWNCGLEHVDEE